MGTPFFIVGLPRSRTAWLSIVTTTQNSICYHEPTANLTSFGHLKELWSDDRHQYVGVSDSSLIFQLGRILSEIGPRTLIIDRDPYEAAKACEAYMAGSGYKANLTEMCENMHTELLAYHGHPLVTWIGWEQLADEAAVSGALGALMPGFRNPKLSELMHMNVQVGRDWILAKVQEPHTQWHMDMSWREGP